MLTLQGARDPAEEGEEEAEGSVEEGVWAEEEEVGTVSEMDKDRMEGGEEASEVEAVSTAEPSRSLSPGSRLWTARSESGGYTEWGGSCIVVHIKKYCIDSEGWEQD